MSHEAEEPQIGIIKFYNPRKGYGFVTRHEGNDVFFHLTHFDTPTVPQPGAVVRFVLGQNREGQTAVHLVVVPNDAVECYGGTITALDAEGGVVMTPDNFEIRFRRSDFIPHTRADSLRVGDEVELNFLVQDADESWRAKVVRAADFQPEAELRPERREMDDEDDNRRLLGILYKTDLDEEAQHAAQVLAERNMRATLSALVSRVFDRRLSPEVRLELVSRISQIYFDDECQVYLDAMARHLAQAVRDEDAESNPAAAEALRLLLDEEKFPVRWSQYLLPFGLSLLRNLVAIPSCHSLLEGEELMEAAEQWMTRVCRHVEQRRSGHGYVMTTALATFDELWLRELLQQPLRRVLARLLVAVDGDGLANQIYHLRDKVSAGFLSVLLPLISQHPDLSAALRAPAQAEIFSQWIETLLRSSGDTLSTETLATVLPLVEEVRSHLMDDATLQRLLRPVTESLTPDELVRMLTAEDLPERAVWACLRHLDRRGELNDLLGRPEIRGLVTDWLRRSSEHAEAAQPREQEVNTALKLIDSLRGSQELGGELVDIGRNLFSGIHERLSRAGSDELVRLLDELDVSSLPGLTGILAGRLADEALDDAARQRLLAWFGGLPAPLPQAAAALAAWRQQPDQVARIAEVVAAHERCRAACDAEALACAEVLEGLLTKQEIGWHDGFISAIETLPIGGEAARLQGFAILLPKRLFLDPTDFAPNRFVRLLRRRGTALGVVPGPVPESAPVCGRLAGPLAIDERNAIVGAIIDADGALCYFEVAQLQSGDETSLQDGDLMRFTRVEAAPGQPYGYVAFNVSTEFTADHLPLLLSTFAGANDVAVAAAAGRQAVELLGEGEAAAWQTAWQSAPETHRQAVSDSLSEEARERLGLLVQGR